jgi:transposase
MKNAGKQRLGKADAPITPLVQGDDRLVGQAAPGDRQGDRPADRGRSGTGPERARLETVPGSGDLSARTLIAELPELGHASRHEIATLTGVAPINRDSGRYPGKGRIQGGRLEVRAPLYMATLVAIRRTPVIRSVHRRLRDAGKLATVALIACMRKLLTMLNAMLRNGTDRASAQT